MLPFYLPAYTPVSAPPELQVMPPGQAQKERHRRAKQRPRVSLGFKVQFHVRLSFTEQSFVTFGAADPVKHSQGRKGKIKVFIRDLVLISHLAFITLI